MLTNWNLNSRNLGKKIVLSVGLLYSVFYFVLFCTGLYKVLLVFSIRWVRLGTFFFCPLQKLLSPPPFWSSTHSSLPWPPLTTTYLGQLGPQKPKSLQRFYIPLRESQTVHHTKYYFLINLFMNKRWKSITIQPLIPKGSHSKMYHRETWICTFGLGVMLSPFLDSEFSKGILAKLHLILNKYILRR